MQRRIAVLVGALLLLLAGAPAAYATAVPFNTHVTIGAHGVEAGAEQEQDTGLIGFCDPDLGCTGFRVTEATSQMTGGTTSGQLTLRGYVCVQDSSSSCSPDGTPFTGVRITERVVDVPEPYLGPFFVHVNFCLWVNSPQDEPHACDLPAIMSEDDVGAPDSGNLAEGLPSDLGLQG